MLKVNQASDRVVMTLCWREDTGWGRVAGSMLRYIEDLVCQGPEIAVFGRHGRTAEPLPEAEEQR